MMDFSSRGSLSCSQNKRFFLPFTHRLSHKIIEQAGQKQNKKHSHQKKTFHPRLIHPISWTNKFQHYYTYCINSKSNPSSSYLVITPTPLCFSLSPFEFMAIPSGSIHSEHIHLLRRNIHSRIRSFPPSLLLFETCFCHVSSTRLKSI